MHTVLAPFKRQYVTGSISWPNWSWNGAHYRDRPGVHKFYKKGSGRLYSKETYLTLFNPEVLNLFDGAIFFFFFG